jgi:hypothetical protein
VLGVGLASAAAALAIALTARAAVRLRRHALSDVASVEKKLRVGDDTEFASAVQHAFAEAAPALLDALNEKSVATSNVAAAALDEALGDLDRALSEGKAIPGAAVRIALLSAGLGAVLELVRDLGGITVALPAAVIGVAAAAVCFELGRNTARRATELRAEWDRIAGAAATRIGLGRENPGRPSVSRAAVGTAGEGSGVAREADQRRRRRRGS